MKTKIHQIPTLLAALVAMLGSTAWGQVTLFSDDFTTDTSANWIIRAGSQTAVDDYSAQFGFNYATNKFVRNGVTNTIPLAPNSTIGVATNGVKLTVNNNDETADTSGVNLYPNLSQTFSNDYAVKFDMWVNYNGTEGGGSGSTEFSIYGVNMSGAETNWAFAPFGDGLWFATTGEGGAARDWRVYVGDQVVPGAPLELQGISGGFLDRDNDGTPEQERFTEPNTAPLKLLFPKPAFETDGVPGKQWVQVEIRQRTNEFGEHVVTWFVDGYVIAQLKHDPFLTTPDNAKGNIMLGAMDPFSSIASPREDNFVIFDNVRVVDLTGVPTNEVVSIVATQPSAAEPGTDGVITISRSGSTVSALQVPIRVAGTATRGADFVTQTNGVTFTVNTVTIPAGASFVDVAIKVLNDGIGESPESAIVVLAGNPSAYDIGLQAYATVEILDDGDVPFASVSRTRIAAYEGNTNSYARFSINFSTPFASSDVTVNYTLGGTAVNGTHYTSIGSSAVITAGSTNVLVTILPVDNSDTVSNRTVTLTLTGGANYVLASTNTNTTVTIFNDDLSPALGTAYSDNFDVDSSPSWTVSLGTTPVRDRATFAYDYSVDGIPSAPRSAGNTTKGLKMEANVSTLAVAAFSGLSAAPAGQSFTGDFRLRFDWWANYPGPFPAGGSGSTQLGTYGIGSGVRAHWPGGALTPADTVYFAMTGDGGSSIDVRAYTNGSATLPTSVLAGGSVDNAAAYYAVFGGLEAPAAQLGAPIYGSLQTGRTASGAPGEVWHDVVITKLGSTLLWHLDGVLMATVNSARFGYNLSTNIFVGQSDINTGASTIPEALFSLYDNLVVETLPAPAVAITNITLSGSSAVLTFTGGTNDPAAAYLLQQSPLVTGPYTNVLSTTITNVSSGVFRAITATNAATQFYRIRR
jgi:hypothetical protein